MVISIMITKKDASILEILKKNADMSSREISEKTGIPVTTVHNRIMKMKKDGVIKNYTVNLDDKKIGKNIGAIIGITINYTPINGERISQESIAKALFNMYEVEETYILTGSTDIVIKVAVSDVDELNNLVINRLRNIAGIMNTQTAIILKEVGIK